jgi:hypothetical protein
LVKVQGAFTPKATGETQNLCRHFVTSHPSDQANPQQLGHHVRAHWMVENPNRWRRDALWREDRCRIQDPNSACVLALLRTALISLIKWNGRDNFQAVFEDVASDQSLGLAWLKKSKFT